MISRSSLASRLAALAFSASVALGAAAAAQPAGNADAAVLRADLHAGQTIRCALSLHIDVEQAVGDGEPESSRLVQRLALLLTVDELDGPRGASVSGRVEEVALTATPRSGDAVEFRTPRVTTDVPPDTQAYKDLASLGEALKGADLRFVVTPDGEIGRVEGLAPLAEAYAAQESFDESVLGLLGADQLARSLEPMFGVRGAGSDARSVGDSWESVETITLGPAGAFEIRTNYQFRNAARGEAFITGQPVITVRPPAERDPASPRVEIGEQESSIALTWSLSDNLLSRRAAVQRVESSWTVGEMTLRQTQTVRTSLERVQATTMGE